MWQADDWAHCKDPAHAAGPMWMDDMHVRAIYDICMALGFQEILEVGCFDGFSTSAIVQAKIDGAVGHLTCVDREIRPALYQTVRRARDHWMLWQDDSIFGIGVPWRYDLIVLDSDHDLATTQREWAAICDHQEPTIIAHDVGRLGGCPGPQWLLRELCQDPEWSILVDEQPREGMRTDRGLMLATTNQSVWEQASRVWPEGRVPER